MSRRIDAIDLVKFHAECDTKTWNIYLTNCYRKRDLDGLALTRNRLQRGMDLAVKRKLSTDKLQHLFIRLNKSIEDTMKKIIREKYPSPCDNPLLAKEYSDELEVKRKRDQEFELYLRKSSF